MKLQSATLILLLAFAGPALADTAKTDESRWLAEGASVSAGSSANARAQEARVIERPFVEPFHRAAPAAAAQTRTGGAWPGAPVAAEPDARGGLWPEVD